MSFPTKVNMPVAKHYTKMPPQQKIHITTTDFMRTGIPFYYEMMPNTKVNILSENYTKFEGMPFPTFGIINNNTRWFFVPLRTIFPMFYEMLLQNQKCTQQGNGIPEVPIIQQGDINKIWETYSTTGGQNYDVHYNAANYTLTAKGRAYVTILKQLGYNYVPNDRTTSVSAIALLAYARVMYDYYLNDKYLNDNTNYASVKALFNYYNPTRAQVISYTELETILFMCHEVMFSPDYFTQAFDKPVGPNINMPSYTIDDITIEGTTKSNIYNHTYSNNSTPLLIGINNGLIANSTIKPSQYIIDALRQLTLFTKKNQYAGDRNIDRYLAMYGQVLNYDKLNQSIYIDTQHTPIKIGDVFATAEGTNIELADYGGKADSSMSNNISWKADEFGVLMAINTIVPQTQVCQGIDAHILRTNVFDFYHEDWDGMGVEAIPVGEVYTGVNDTSNYAPNTPFSTVFGFKPRYASYKTFTSKLTGDFSNNSTQQVLASNHMFRVFSDTSHTSVDTAFVHSNQFCHQLTTTEFDRIFYTDKQDNIKQIFMFQIELEGNFRPLYDDILFDLDRTSDNSVNLDTRGTQFN